MPGRWIEDQDLEPLNAQALEHGRQRRGYGLRGMRNGAQGFGAGRGGGGRTGDSGSRGGGGSLWGALAEGSTWRSRPLLG